MDTNRKLLPSLSQKVLTYFTELGFDSDTCATLTAKLNETILALVPEIEATFSEKKKENLRGQFHALKGALANCGLADEALLASALEKLAKDDAPLEKMNLEMDEFLKNLFT